MQPYFLPYIGYWQLLGAVDTFVVYDNIQYTKKGWINRNRFLQNGQDALFTIPLKQDSDFLNVADRSIADSFDRKKLLNQFSSAYRKAPFFNEVFPLFTEVVCSGQKNLFEYIYGSIVAVREFLRIKTPLAISSSLNIDHSLRSEAKVMAICKELGATQYLNPSGGRELYSKETFLEQGIELGFIQTRPIVYSQFGNAFVPSLSIIDVMMFNSREAITAMLTEYDVS
ncbi:MAG TPA: WbqC family protein [Verrucomicrobiae bacterium]|nr:WbqC family protein [Verrucomicrobiae bacterium]